MLDAAKDTQAPLFEVENLSLKFKLGGKRFLHAVNNVSFAVRAGETLGLVGESGCGKSSLARALLRLYEPESGSVKIDGMDLLKANKQEVKLLRRKIQMVFQDPFASLDPRQTVGDAIIEPMTIAKLFSSRSEYEKRCASLLDRVGLSARQMKKFPHEFSGGQLQRVGIARALALSPKVLVADEPVSALDVSIQAQVVNLLKEIQRDLNLAIVFIAHDLSVVRHVSHQIAVMYLGKIVEWGEAEAVCTHPSHPYTKMLIESIPCHEPMQLSNNRRVVEDLPSPLNIPSGCPFHTRCFYAKEICRLEEPKVTRLIDMREIRCHEPR